MESDTNASHVTQVSSTTSVDTTSASMLTLVNTANILNNNSSDLESDGSLYIENLKQQTVRAMIPAMSYLILISLIGLVGNSLVLLVYSGKFRQTSTRVFIVAIASFDIVTNIVAIPGEIYDMFHIWDFNKPNVCKIRLFFNSFTTIVAAMTLVAVAVVRYRKICTPFGKQVSVKMAVIISIALTMAASLFSVPYAIINGRHSRQTLRAGIYGYECSTDDRYINTIWPFVNGAFFFFLFFACSTPLVVLYILIGVKVWKHRRIQTVISSSNHDNELNVNDSSTSADAGVKPSEDKRNRRKRRIKNSSVMKSSDTSKGGLPRQNFQKQSFAKMTDLYSRTGDGANSSKLNDSGDIRMAAYLNGSADADYRLNTRKTSKSITKNSDLLNSAIFSSTTEINHSSAKNITTQYKDVGSETLSKTNGATLRDLSGKTVEISNTKSEDFMNVNSLYENEPKDEKDDFEKDTRKATELEKQIKIKEADEVYKEISSETVSTVNDTSKDLSNKIPQYNKRYSFKYCTKHLPTKSEDVERTCSLFEERNERFCRECSLSNNEPRMECSEISSKLHFVSCLEEDKVESDNFQNVPYKINFNPNTGNNKNWSVLSNKTSHENNILRRSRKIRDTSTITLPSTDIRTQETNMADTGDKGTKITTPLKVVDTDRKSSASIETNTAENKGNTNAENKGNTNAENKGNTNAENKGNTNDAIKSKPRGNDIQKESDREIKIQVTSKEATTNVRAANRRPCVGHTTCMLIIISSVYILSFLPFLVLIFAKYLSPRTFESLQGVSLAMYNIFLRSYFLNSAANPIIYSLCDVRFRRECMHMLKCK